MVSLFEWIQTHLNQTLAAVGALAVITSALVAPQWWGERAFGFLLGIAISTIALSIIVTVVFRLSSNRERFLPWLLLIVATTTALIFRRFSGQSFSIPVQVSTPALPSPQSLLLFLVGIVLLLLLFAFGSSLRKGDGVAIESHWGGLGGGISGWTVSAPLIYLLGIVFLLGVSVTMAWRIFPPPKELASAPATPSPSPSPSPTPSLAPSSPPASPLPSVRSSPSG